MIHQFMCFSFIHLAKPPMNTHHLPDTVSHARDTMCSAGTQVTPSRASTLLEKKDVK